MTAESIVSNSTFPDFGTLTAQHAWYYNQPGATGVANRSFQQFEIASLEARIAALTLEHANVSEEELSPSEALGELARALQVVVEEVGAAGEQARAAYLADEWRSISRISENADVPPALVSYLQVETFAVYCNLKWLTIV